MSQETRACLAFLNHESLAAIQTERFLEATVTQNGSESVAK
jgi:hypothetical protein